MINDRKPCLSQTDLSETDENDYEELDKVFKLLAEWSVPKGDNSINKQNLFQTGNIIWKSLYGEILELFRGLSLWEKISLCGLIAFLVAIIIYSKTIPEWIKAIAIILLVACMFILLVFGTLNGIRQTKSSKEFTGRSLIKAGEEAIKDQKKIIELSKIASQLTLKFTEIKLKSLVEQTQVRERATSNFVPILAIFFVALWISIMGTPSNNLGYGLVAGVSGLVGLTSLVLKSIFESDLQSQVMKYKRYLSFIEQAQLVAANTEASRDTSQADQQKKKHSLMSKLKSIKIDGPEDFAINLDLYLSGEKRVETDLR